MVFGSAIECLKNMLKSPKNRGTKPKLSRKEIDAKKEKRQWNCLLFAIVCFSTLTALVVVISWPNAHRHETIIQNGLFILGVVGMIIGYIRRHEGNYYFGSSILLVGSFVFLSNPLPEDFYDYETHERVSCVRAMVRRLVLNITMALSFWMKKKVLLVASFVTFLFVNYLIFLGVLYTISTVDKMRKALKAKKAMEEKLVGIEAAKMEIV